MPDVTCSIKGNDQQCWQEGRKESLHFLHLLKEKHWQLGKIQDQLREDSGLTSWC